MAAGGAGGIRAACGDSADEAFQVPGRQCTKRRRPSSESAVLGPNRPSAAPSGSKPTAPIGLEHRNGGNRTHGSVRASAVRRERWDPAAAWRPTIDELAAPLGARERGAPRSRSSQARRGARPHPVRNRRRSTALTPVKTTGGLVDAWRDLLPAPAAGRAGGRELAGGAGRAVRGRPRRRPGLRGPSASDPRPPAVHASRAVRRRPCDQERWRRLA